MGHEIERWATSRFPGMAVDRQTAREVRDVMTNTAMNMLKIDADFTIARHSMQKLADLDHERRRLAGEDPTLNSLLGEVEVRFAQRVARDDPFGAW